MTKDIIWKMHKGELATPSAIEKFKKQGFTIIRVKPKTDTFYHTVKKRMVSVPNFSMAVAAEHRRRFGKLPYYYYSPEMVREEQKGNIILYVSTAKTNGRHQIGIVKRDRKRKAKRRSPLW